MRQTTLDRRQALLHDAIAAIAADHGRDVDLDVVARRIGTSRRQLQRVFSELSEKSFRDTLAAVRMGRARTLLAGTDERIAEIGRAVGYSEPAQFTKAFRHHHGMTPRDYRRRAAAGDGHAS